MTSPVEGQEVAGDRQEGKVAAATEEERRKQRTAERLKVVPGQ
jgi:hypothetical protein